MRRIMFTLLMVLLFPIISFAGWETDGIGTKYKIEDGSYKTGWHEDFDGKWYYFDEAGYMLKDTMTPDGYTLNPSGEWIEDGGNNKNMTSYDNKEEFEVSSYASGPSRFKQFGYSLPVTVYYNNEYTWNSGKKLSNVNIGVSKEGVLYAEYTMSEAGYRYKLNVTNRYISEDNTYVEDISEVETFCTSGNPTTSSPLMEYRTINQDKQLVRAEVYINVEKAD